MSAPLWLDSAIDRDCERCPEPIPAGDPAAWLPRTDQVVCLACGDAVEREQLRAVVA